MTEAEGFSGMLGYLQLSQRAEQEKKQVCGEGESTPTNMKNITDWEI